MKKRFMAFLLAAAGLWVPLSMTVSASPDEGGFIDRLLSLFGG